MRKSNEGFSLVELIVVLVILAILAALIVPALLGYIDRSKDSKVLIKARNAMTASQATADRYYGIITSSKGKYDKVDKNTADSSYWISVTNTMNGFNDNAFSYMKDTYNLMDADNLDPFYMVTVINKGKVVAVSYYDVNTNKVAQWYQKTQKWNVIEKISNKWALDINGKPVSENFNNYYKK